MALYNCYIIKVSAGESINYYKIGEKLEDSNRENSLVEKYTAFNKGINSKVINHGIPLPESNLFRLNDKTVRKKLNKHLFTSVDANSIKALVLEDDGASEFVELTNKNSMSDEEIEQEIIRTISELAKDESNFKVKLPDIDLTEAKEDDPTKKHLVNSTGLNIIENKIHLYEDIGQKILLIGQFEPEWVASLVGYNDVYILYDSRNTKYEYISYIQKRIPNEHCFTNIKELIKMCKKFDVIIANPPYSLGNEITSAIIKYVDFKNYINLMPKNDYSNKPTAIYKNVVDIENAEDFFEDATVGEVLTLATISKKNVNRFNSYDDLEFLTYDKTFLKFYIENTKKVCNYNYSYLYIHNTDKIDVKQEKLEKIDVDTSFHILFRTAGHGVHEDKDAFDIKWNIYKNIDKNIFIDRINEDGFIFFKSKIEKDNFTDYWYRNGKKGLCHKLIKGLNKLTGVIDIAIPRVDWSRPWTDEEILKEYGYTEEEIKEILG